ncbi:MAG TPA: hypothetical protein ENJ32_00850 [Crenotrichaceae bacterium]|nr:hypothetical protein [Crenotrichaceae bacterium]
MKKKVIAAAVAATLGHTAANAVSVNPNGLGQVLIYPYYTVQESGAGTFDTLVTVVNTTNLTKAVKVRFIESKASIEVLDFNLYLSPNDVWTGAIVADDAGGARLITADKSCTTPSIPAGGVAFRNQLYDPAQGGQDDGAGVGLDRTREGYIEMFDMGTVIDSKDGTPAGAAPNPFTPEAWALHGADGVPADCNSLSVAWSTGAWNNPPAGFNQGSINVAQPVGGLFGTVSLINVSEGSDYGYDAVALSDFFVPFSSTDAFHTQPSSLLPNLGNVLPKVSNILAGNSVITSTWLGAGATSVDPVSAVLMNATMENDYVTEANIAAATSFVYTMPTKRFHVNIGINAGATAPFTESFFGSACEPVTYTAWDREEKTEVPEVLIDFSPTPVVIPDQSVLCFEANVVNINDTDVLGSQTADQNKVNVSFDNGWLLTDFTNNAGHRMVADDGTTYHGLPVIGFSAQRYFNGTLATSNGTALSNYGGLFQHKNSAMITDAAGVNLAAPARSQFPDNDSVLSQ